MKRNKYLARARYIIYLRRTSISYIILLVVFLFCRNFQDIFVDLCIQIAFKRYSHTSSFLSDALEQVVLYYIFLPLPNYVIHGSLFQRIVSIYFVSQTCFIFESCWSATCFGEHFRSISLCRMRHLLACCLGWYQCAGVLSRCPRFPNNR